MNKRIGLQLAAYSILLLVLSYLAYERDPGPGQLTLVTGAVGGSLCFVWAIRAITGVGAKAPALLTLVTLSLVMLSQGVRGWSTEGEGSGQRAAAALAALIFVISWAMLMRIAYAGVMPAGSRPRQASLEKSGQRSGL